MDYEFFSEKMDVQKKDNTIAFVGALNVAHNENGIIHFIENSLPEIRERVPGTVLYIIGGGASEKLQQYASDSIIFTGRVPDVRVEVERCQVFICPLQFGSGIKTKNLEAMAMGMPVVTTPVGAENIDAIDGYDWLVGKNDREFTEQVIRLLVNNEMRRQIGDNGQAFVKENFSWRLTENIFYEVFSDERKERL